MKRITSLALGVALALCFLAAAASTNAFAPLPIDVQASPQSIMPDSVTPYMTIHTDIKLSVVDRSTLELSGLPVARVTVDNQGNLVAKVEMAALKEIVSPPSARLVLTGLTKDGLPFEGSDTVTVVAPEGK